MNKQLILILIPLTLVSCSQNKKPADKGKERIDHFCDDFMQKFLNGKIPEAVDGLKQNSVMSHATLDTMQAKIIYQATNLFPAYGKILSSEFITERKVKDFICKRFYILKFEKYYLKFSFTLYNNSSTWKVTSFNYDEDLIELLY
jgi:hypothetical protein